MYRGGVPKCLAPSISVSELKKGITLSWRNINVTSDPVMSGPPFRKTVEFPAKRILMNVNGFVKPGTLLAIMGSSGAGKSTLLNVLNRRNRGTLNIEGEVRVNEQNIEDAITSLSAYIQQEDLFISTLTVSEQLNFQAQLKMGKTTTKRIQKDRVQHLIHELGLMKCKDVLIGKPGITKGISGGERKRLAFASETLTDPALLFCDEPTSGLDSFMAQNIVQCLKNLAARGKTIVCTIHQPASETFAMFDDLLLMSEGRVTFLGKANKAFEFFERNGFPCPANYNPADHFIHTLAIMPGQEDECREKCKILCDVYEESQECTDMMKELKPMHRPSNSQTRVEDVHDPGAYNATNWQQLNALFWRSWLSNFREPMIFKARLAQTLAISLILGVVYFQIKVDQKGVMNINGAMFLLQLQITFGNMFAVINTFPLEFPILVREHHNGLYRVDVYYISKVLAEWPSFLILPIIFSSISYWMIGLYPDTENFGTHLLVMLLVANLSIAFGYLVSSCTADVAVALSITPMVMIPLVMFGGFFLNKGSVPVWLKWLEYLSWFNYANEILVVNQWINIDNIECEYVHVNTSAAGMAAPPGNITDPAAAAAAAAQANATAHAAAAAAASSRCFTKGIYVIEGFSYSEDNMTTNWVVMLGMLAFFRIFTLFLLYFRTRNMNIAKPKPVSCIPAPLPGPMPSMYATGSAFGKKASRHSIHSRASGHNEQVINENTEEEEHALDNAPYTQNTTDNIV